MSTNRETSKSSRAMDTAFRLVAFGRRRRNPTTRGAAQGFTRSRTVRRGRPVRFSVRSPCQSSPPAQTLAIPNPTGVNSRRCRLIRSVSKSNASADRVYLVGQQETKPKRKQKWSVMLCYGATANSAIWLAKACGWSSVTNVRESGKNSSRASGKSRLRWWARGERKKISSSPHTISTGRTKKGKLLVVSSVYRLERALKSRHVTSYSGVPHERGEVGVECSLAHAALGDGP